MFKLFRTSSKKGDKKKKVTKSNKNQSSNDIPEEVSSTPDGNSVENTNSEANHPLQRKDSIPIGIKWITQPSPHVIQDQGSSNHSTSNDELRENSSTPSRGSQLTESRVSQLTESRVSQLTESRVSQLTENSDINIKEKDGNSLKSSNTEQVENSLPIDKSNKSLLNPEITSNGMVCLENLCSDIKVSSLLQDEISNKVDIKQKLNKLLCESDEHLSNIRENGSQNILELLLAKFNRFEENIMVELNHIKESQEKQEKRLSEIQTRQEEVNDTFYKIISSQFSSSANDIKVDEDNLAETENVHIESVSDESSKETCSNNLPTIQEVDVNVDQCKKDLPEADPQSPSISSSSSPVTSHTSEQPQSQDLSTKSLEPIPDRTDVIVSTSECLSVSLPTPSPAPALSPCTPLPEAQLKAISIMAVHNSMSMLEQLRSPISSRTPLNTTVSILEHLKSPISSRTPLNITPAVPSPFRSSNPPIKHSPPTKPKRLSLQIPMSSSPSQGSAEDFASCPLRRAIEWPEHSPVVPVIHSPFAAHKPNVPLNSLRNVQDRDRRMFITITP